MYYEQCTLNIALLAKLESVNVHYIPICQTYIVRQISHSETVWQIWHIIPTSFTKLKPSKLVLTINNLLDDLLIRQTFFTKCSL